MTDYITWTDTYVSPLDATTMTLYYYAFPEDATKAQTDFAVTKDAMEYFAQIYGEYPFIDEKYGIAETPNMMGSMEHQTITSLTYRATRAAVNWDVIVHELGHQWWGDFVTCADWRELWLNESFATYAEFVWADETYGEEFLDGYRRDADWAFFYAGALYDNPVPFSRTIYDGGGMILHMLRYVVGDEAFFDGLAPPGVPPCAGRRPEGAPPPPGAPPHPYSSAVLGGASAMEDRRSALAAFKAGGVRFLIATDVAARGLDVAGLPFVIQVTLPDPNRPEEYVHRIGRVGRAGARGLAVSLLSTVPEKVWFVTRKGYRPWAVSGGVKAADTRPAEDGGHTVWLDEGEALAAIQARLGGVEVPEMGPDLSLPWGPGAGGGGKGGGAGYGGPAGPAAVAAAAAEEEQKARLAALRPAVERLAALETESQRAYFSLRMGGGWGGASAPPQG